MKNINYVIAKRYFPLCLIPYALSLFLIFGCNTNQQTTPDYQSQIEQLEIQLQQSKLLLKQKDQQIANLQKLPSNYIDHITSVHKISLGRFTRIEDTDGDLNVDSLVVYLQLSDKSLAKVKVAGSFTIELWDLNAPEDSNLIKSWTFDPKELESHWDGTLSSHYRFNLTIDNYKSAKETLTLKCSFNELHTGKPWTAQKMLNLK